MTVNTNAVILGFTVDFENIDVELDFSQIKQEAAFKIKKVSTPVITL